MVQRSPQAESRGGRGLLGGLLSGFTGGPSLPVHGLKTAVSRVLFSFTLNPEEGLSYPSGSIMARGVRSPVLLLRRKSTRRISQIRPVDPVSHSFPPPALGPTLATCRRFISTPLSFRAFPCPHPCPGLFSFSVAWLLYFHVHIFSEYFAPVKLSTSQEGEITVLSYF